jgi:hypothetical protein
MQTHEIIPAVVDDKVPSLRLHVGSPYTYYGDPLVSPVTLDTKLQMNMCEIKEEYFYINNTYRPITIVKRDGLAVNIGHVDALTNNTFTIRKILTFKAQALRSAIVYLNNISENECADLIELKKALTGIQRSNYSEASVIIDYVVTVAAIVAKGGCIYHQQGDIVITFKEPSVAEAHPYSSRFLNIKTFGNTKDYRHQDELNIKIRLVDHSPMASDRFINIAGKTFVLKPQRDSMHRTISSVVNGKRVETTHEDYLQIFYSVKNDPAIIEGEGVGNFTMSLADAKENISFYDTHIEAINSGSIEMTRKEKLMTLTHEVELIKASVVKQKALLDQEEIETKRQLNIQQQALENEKNDALRRRLELESINLRLQAEAAQQKETQTRLDAQMQALENSKRLLDMTKKSQDEDLARSRAEFENKMKNDNLYWKDFYETKQATRKEAMDILKFIPGVLIGLAGVAVAWMKFSNATKPT